MSGAHSRRGPSRDDLAIRWFTPRGRQVLRELELDLRHNDGAHLLQITEELRREGVSDDVLDLRGINLRGRDLGGAQLAGADLRGARLDRANLQGACLDGARLDFCSLGNARLRNASLKGASIQFANAGGADLSEADLEGASLDGTRLEGASLRRTFVKDVNLEAAKLQGVDLSQVRRRVHLPSQTARRHTEVGAPPLSEPRRPSRRFKTHMGLKRPAPAGAPAATTRPRSPRDFEHALAELLLDRDRVSRITAVVDGQEVVLFEGTSVRGLRLA